MLKSGGAALQAEGAAHARVKGWGELRLLKEQHRPAWLEQSRGGVGRAVGGIREEATVHRV